MASKFKFRLQKGDVECEKLYTKIFSDIKNLETSLITDLTGGQHFVGEYLKIKKLYR